jgi:hypothetical protein
MEQNKELSLVSADHAVLGDPAGPPVGHPHDLLHGHDQATPPDGQHAGYFPNIIYVFRAFMLQKLFMMWTVSSISKCNGTFCSVTGWGQHKFV